MNKYTSSGFRPVQADSMKEAAESFALRQARKEYGKAGRVRGCNLNTWSEDGSLGEFEAFIGTHGRERHNRNTTTGRNFRFTVRA